VRGIVRRPLEARAQGVTLEQLGDDEPVVRLAAVVVDAEDVRVRERGERLGLALEAREHRGIASERGGEDLERDVAIELEVARAVDLAHAAGADGRDDFVRPESVAGREPHGEIVSPAGQLSAISEPWGGSRQPTSWDVAAHTPAIQRGEERQSAMPEILEAVTFSAPGRQRQYRIEAMSA
jgi:hypothetical protein